MASELQQVLLCLVVAHSSFLQDPGRGFCVEAQDLTAATGVRERQNRQDFSLGKQKNGGGDRTSPMIFKAACSRGGDRRAVYDQAAVFV